MTCVGFLLSRAELVLVEGVEFPESEVMLRRLELRGIRDWESRLVEVRAVEACGASSGLARNVL